MKIWAFPDDTTVFIVERDGQFTHDDWPCDAADMHLMIDAGILVEISYEEARRRVKLLGPYAAYWPLPAREAVH